MNNLIKYLLYLLVLLLLVSWIITVGKSCGKTEAPAATQETYEITEDNGASLEEAENANFGEELESILDEEEEKLESIVEDEKDLDYSSYDPKKDVAPEEKKEVKKEVVKPKQKPATKPKPTPASTSSGRYLVIVGSYIHPDNADKRKAKLKKLGYSSEVVVFDLSQYHTVLAGRYSNFDTAQGVVNKLSGKGIDAYVKKQTF